MVTVQVRNLEIGSERAKICVPIVDTTEQKILETAEKIVNAGADLVEWRADWFEDVFDSEKVQEVLGKLRGVLGELPVLFTCRTSNEGGQINLTKEQYLFLIQCAIESGHADLIDLEIFSYKDVAERIVEMAHGKNVKVVGSNHDFQSTPEKDEIVKRMCSIQSCGVDIGKIAVMPQNRQDVLTLLSATEEMVREHDDTPIVTMSMGTQGIISRICGEVFGSAMTFATVGKASAPGQLAIEELREAMKVLR